MAEVELSTARGEPITRVTIQAPFKLPKSVVIKDEDYIPEARLTSQVKTQVALVYCSALEDEKREKYRDLTRYLGGKRPDGREAARKVVSISCPQEGSKKAYRFYLAAPHKVDTFHADETMPGYYEEVPLESLSRSRSSTPSSFSASVPAYRNIPRTTTAPTAPSPAPVPLPYAAAAASSSSVLVNPTEMMAQMMQNPALMAQFMALATTATSTTATSSTLIATAEPPPQPKRKAGGAHSSMLESAAHMHASWIFGGIAELIDNAADAKATTLDIVQKRFEATTGPQTKVVLILDNGVGMDYEGLVGMCMFGHEQRADAATAIGRFGVGFKNGSMRFAKDALVLTKTATSHSVALLSQTHNEGRAQLEIPIISFNKDGTENYSIQERKEDHQRFKESIFAISPLRSELALGQELGHILKTGTMIMLWNLKEDELDFTTDKLDIRIKPISQHSKFVRPRNAQMATDVPLDYSLRAYMEVMFHTPTMKMNLRGKKVVTRLMAKSLVDTPAPRRLVHPTFKDCKLTVGYDPASKEKGLGGVMMYWHNRLIKAYHRVGVQRDNNDAGNGIIGIVECDHLEPVNSKQDFTNKNYQETETWLRDQINSYFYEYFDKDNVVDKDMANAKPEHTWVQCDRCQKWRKLPKTATDLPESWYCHLNPDPKFRSCEVPAEPTDEGEAVISIGRTEEQKKTPAPAARPSAPSISPSSSSSALILKPALSSSAGKTCLQCGAYEQHRWRSGPKGKKTLCNACGIRWRTQMKREMEDQNEDEVREPPKAPTAAKGSGKKRSLPITVMDDEDMLIDDHQEIKSAKGKPHRKN